MGKPFVTLTCLIFASLICASDLQAQSPLDGFDPNANGRINVIVVQPNGKILIGGTFTRVLGVARNHIARLNTDGTLDTTFNPDANGTVLSIAMQSGGKVLVGGNFASSDGRASIGGQPRNYLARLNLDGRADSFDPNPGCASSVGCGVYSIAVPSDRQALVGGHFQTIGGRRYGNIARLNTDGTLDTTFHPEADGTVRSIAVDQDKNVLVGGDFQHIGLQVRHYIARLKPEDGSPDSFNPDANHFVDAISVQADGKVLVGGAFSATPGTPVSIGGAWRNYLARLNPNGSADPFDPNPSGSVLSIAVQSDGKILVGGSFSRIGGGRRSNIARLNPEDSRADSFGPDSNGTVYAIAVQSDGKVLVGGDFSRLRDDVRNNIARVEVDGGLDRTLDLGALDGSVDAIAIQPNGKFLLGGSFTRVLGMTRNHIARLNSDGTLDPFNPNLNGTVYSIALQHDDDKVLVGGEFTTIGGLTFNYIARLYPDGRLDPAFSPGPDGVVSAIAVQRDGNILVGGMFTLIGGRLRKHIARLSPTTGTADIGFDPNPTNTSSVVTANSNIYSIIVQPDDYVLVGGGFNNIGTLPRNHIARLKPDGTADSFDPNANSDVFAIALQSDGNVLVAGQFSRIGGRFRNRIALLNSLDGAADPLFDPIANNSVRSIVVQANGKILVTGFFTASPDFSERKSIGRERRNYIARLNEFTGTADSFDPNPGSVLDSIAVQSDGKVLVGGRFRDIGGQRRVFFARLSNDTAAFSNVEVTRTTITWTRSGSAPQLSRATFEQSEDYGATYTRFAGDPTPLDSGHTLTVPMLRLGQNILIRARGYYRSGNSETTIEKVQIVFLRP